MKGILVLIIGLLSVEALGQQVLPVQHDTLRHKHEFTLTGNLELNATSIERAISSKMALGGLITNDLKDRSLAKHKDVNRVGLDLQGEFEWRNGAVSLFKREKFGFLIKTGAYTIGSGAYSTDLFRLAYYGNQPFLGEILNFDGTGFQTTSFQKVGFGIFDKINKSSISLNVVNVSSHTNADLKNAEMLSDRKSVV